MNLQGVLFAQLQIRLNSTYESRERNIPDLWDFGTNLISMSAMHAQSLRKVPAKDSHPASFAVASDMNPWMFMVISFKPEKMMHRRSY
jgi:hypothetical protein